MKLKTNQGFTSFDFLTTALGFAIIFSISAPIVKRNLQSGLVDTAQQECNSVGRSLLSNNPTSSLGFVAQLNVNNVMKTNTRNIASIDGSSQSQMPSKALPPMPSKNDAWSGQTGKDPWGNPYHFRFVKNKLGNPSVLVVWSDGPDSKAQSQPEKWDHFDELRQIRFEGDDVGSVIPVR